MKAKIVAVLCAGVLSAGAAGGCSESNPGSSRTESSAAESSAAETSSAAVTTSDPAVSSAAETQSVPGPDSEAVSSAAEPVIEIDPLDELAAKLPDTELEDKTVRRLYTTALGRTADGQAMPSERLFEKKYGGTVMTDTVPLSELFGRLSAMVMSNEAPDLIPTDNMDLFPRGVSDRLFMPLDVVIDPSEELWSSTEELSAFFTCQGKRYAAVFEAMPEYVCVYNKKTVRENSLDDPAVLYSQGEWTHGWFETLCRTFTEGGDGRTALSGIALSALSETTGVPLLTMQNGQLVSNLGNESLAEAQNWMFSLSEQGFCSDMPANAIGTGNALFCPESLDILSQSREACERFGDPGADEVMFLPLPKEGKQFISAKLRGYFLGAGSKNPKGAAAYLDCLFAASEADKDAEEQRLTEVCGWNEDMIVMRRECFRLAEEAPVLDCSKGLPGDTYDKLLAGVLGRTVRRGDSAVSWEDTVEELRRQLDFAVMAANDTEPTGP